MLRKELIVRIRGSIHLVPIEEILFMEKERRRIRVHTAKKDYRYYARFDELVERLDGRFIWCHRSYIVNMERVAYLEDMHIGMDDSTEVVFGKNTFHRFKRQFDTYLERQAEGTAIIEMFEQENFDLWKNLEYNPLYTCF